MAEIPSIRLAKAATIFNVSTGHLAEKLRESGFTIEDKPTFKLTSDMIAALEKVFGDDKAVKELVDNTQFHWSESMESIYTKVDKQMEREDRRNGIYKNAYLVGSPGYIGLPNNDSPECTEYWNTD